MNPTADKTQRVEFIVQKIKTFKKQILALKTYGEGPNPDRFNSNLRLESLSTLYQSYLRYNDELTTTQPEHPIIEEFDSIDSLYFEVAAKARRLTEPHHPIEPLANPTGNSTVLNNTSMIARQDLPRLPQIKVPTFDGNRADWANFKNKFITLVHDRTDIGDGVKAGQLFAHLSDKALAKVNHLDPSEDDYHTAWNSLLQFYDQKRIVAVKHLHAILDLPKLSKASADSLSSLVDEARQHLHILKRLDAQPSDELVVCIIERCLPPAIFNKWQDQLEINELPKLDSLFTFLQKTIFKCQAWEESAKPNSSHQSQKRLEGGTPQNQAKKFKTGHSFVTDAAPPNPSNSSCLKCNADHRLFKCPTFNSLKVQERWDFIKGKKVCRNCLSSHPHPCKSSGRCKRCSRNHHTLLHADSGSNGSSDHSSHNKDKSSLDQSQA